MRILAFCLCISMPLLLTAQRKIDLSSPDGNIIFSFFNENAQAAYSVSYKKQVIVDKSFLSLEFKDASFAHNLKAGKPVYHDSTEDYNLIAGKTGHVHDAYKEMLIPVQSANNNKHIIRLNVRAFNDGIAFQYRFPAQGDVNSLELNEENTTFNLAGNPVVKA